MLPDRTHGRKRQVHQPTRPPGWTAFGFDGLQVNAELVREDIPMKTDRGCLATMDWRLAEWGQQEGPSGHILVTGVIP